MQHSHQDARTSMPVFGGPGSSGTSSSAVQASARCASRKAQRYMPEPLRGAKKKMRRPAVGWPGRGATTHQQRRHRVPSCLTEATCGSTAETGGLPRCAYVFGLHTEPAGKGPVGAVDDRLDSAWAQLQRCAAQGAVARCSGGQWVGAVCEQRVDHRQVLIPDRA